MNYDTLTGKKLRRTLEVIGPAVVRVILSGGHQVEYTSSDMRTLKKIGVDPIYDPKVAGRLCKKWYPMVFGYTLQSRYDALAKTGEREGPMTMDIPGDRA